MLAGVLLTVASAVVFYFLIGYPILLAISRRAAPPVRKDLAFQPTLSVLVAVHNGAEFLQPKLESLLALDYPAQLREILVISDGSTDSTETIASSFANRGVRLLSVPRGGKAAALNAGLAQASGDILFFTDVRQTLDRHALSHLAANFADPTVGAVTGELRLLNPARAGEQADMELYWRFELWTRSHHSRIDSIFSTTGCIYALRRSLASPLPPDTISDDGTFSLRAFFRGYRVIFDPEALAFDYPAAEGGEFRRRLRTLAGLWQLFVRLPQLFSSANRMRFHFLSYKFGRLVLPWAILLILGSTLALTDSRWRNFLLVDELMLVALAVLDRFVPRAFFLKRVSSPARTFVAMNAAALLAVLVFFVPPGTLWRPTRIEARR
ncbi:MAG TPA: glycosyltransferase family 2 protein [Bryobacteraceae bacterium]|jgi:cellulose synthase/poly-beta-1,6-N-acetylglucosamine synthase-like glycosyltransferase